MRVLVTNDDGVASPGLWHLAGGLATAGHDVVVAAPQHDSSGFAAAVGDIAPGAHIEVVPASPPAGSPGAGLPAWGVAGPPARCVLAGLIGVFGDRPELVVSGINAGANTGRFLQLHSGTLGAALAAANSGLSAMAVSLDVVESLAAVGVDACWPTAASVAAALVGQLAGRPARTVWNVNVPNIEAAALRGIAEAQPGASRSRLAVEEVAAGSYRLASVPHARQRADDDATDRSLLDAGYVAIAGVTPPALVPVGPVDLRL